MNNQYQVGDIVLVKFHPSTGTELKKYRPAVIVVNLAKIDQRFTLIAPLTTQIKQNHPSEIKIKNNPALKHDSLLLCWYLLCIDNQKIIKKLGQLEKKDQELMRVKTKELLCQE